MVRLPEMEESYWQWQDTKSPNKPYNQTIKQSSKSCIKKVANVYLTETRKSYSVLSVLFLCVIHIIIVSELIVGGVYELQKNRCPDEAFTR